VVTGDDDSFETNGTPEDSPERPTPNVAREMGGRFNHMAQREEAVTRSVRYLQMDRHMSDMAKHGQPRVVEIDLTEEERIKRKHKLLQSTQSERQTVIKTHPFADSPTIKNSLVEWIATFKNLPRNPGTVSEFISSGALYFIMEEIEPDYFQEFPYSVISKKDASSQQDPKVLKKVYKHMLVQMELWFENRADNAKKASTTFRPDLVNLKKLIEQKDINELLVLVEFILVIVLHGSQSLQLVETFATLTDEAANDFQELIQSKQIEESELNSDYTNTFIDAAGASLAV